jgi:phage baseplate assembly protein W
MGAEKNFLGSGWAFPVSVDSVTGRVGESSGEEKIAQAIQLILQTRKGEQIMRPEFGCDLARYTFAEMNYTVMSEIEIEVKKEIILWEPRVIDVEVTCKMDSETDGLLLIDISYVVRSTNNPYNLVYPFYLNEAG